MKIKLYFCNMNNFGDALNKYIFGKCFGVEAVYADSWHADYAGIGSIIDHLLLQTKDFFKLLKNFLRCRKPVTLLSCGLGWQKEYYLGKTRFLKNMIFKRKIKVLSLRGELTKAQIARIQPDLDLENIVLGDMGLLASYLLDEKSEKKYNLGICPHYADAQDPIFQKILAENPDSIILDTRDEPIEFLKKLSQCRCIISTGLHPLIAADSLGIPNLWCRTSEKTTTRYKYYDYYSVFSLKPEPVDLFNEKVSMQKVMEEYRVDPVMVEAVKNNLYNYHKKYFDELIDNSTSTD